MAKITKQDVLKSIRDEMKKQGVTYYRLEKLTDINRVTLQRNIEGVTEMSLSTYVEICNALSIAI